MCREPALSLGPPSSSVPVRRETESRIRFPSESIVRKMYAVSNRLKLLANLTASRRCISASFTMARPCTCAVRVVKSKRECERVVRWPRCDFIDISRYPFVASICSVKFKEPRRMWLPKINPNRMATINVDNSFRKKCPEFRKKKRNTRNIQIEDSERFFTIRFSKYPAHYVLRVLHFEKFKFPCPIFVILLLKIVVLTSSN